MTPRAELLRREAERKLHQAVEDLAEHPHNVVRALGVDRVRGRAVAGAEEGSGPIEHVTNHSLRRTFCALLYEAGATPAYVMAQMGHTDASLALEVHSKVMERKRDTGQRMDAFIRGGDWAANGQQEAESLDAVAILENGKVA